ncbi:mitochondrial intermembrane space import and assembly protein 40 [Teleopsis dalmanni]|uniref:mitochondrial intermembrane space import and assembly protein 40 n=1 Tax=Teleopsis dalmanni TaxID=139649 RepID=UPI0018CE06F9|nr:mitochondrial intermembrane space import and assembly protein 40 [Teleopsis dalmanni]
MSYCKSIGKDKVMFVTMEEHSTPSKVELPPPEPQPGVITETGEINWSCPCLGGMATGPCGVQFRDAFSCFHYSTEEPKGSDCYNAFRTMQDCFQQYPTVYNKGNSDAKESLDMESLDQNATAMEDKTLSVVDKKKD